MALDVEMYRRTLYLPAAQGTPRRISVIDIEPEGAASTLVFVHGYGGRTLQWLYQMRYFGQYSRVVAPDLRGHGHSDDRDEPRHTLDGLVDDLEWTLRELGVRAPFGLVSHSFGGAIAAEYALRHPEDVSGLMLIGVPSRFIVPFGARSLMSLPGGLTDPLARQLGIALYAPVRTLRRMHDGSMAPWRGAERLKELRVPTLVVLGQRDTVFAQQHYTAVPRLIPGAQQVVIPVSAHLVQLERPDAVNRAIRRFLDPKRPRERGGAPDTASPNGSSPNGSSPDGSTPGDAPNTSGGREARSGAASRLVEMPWLQYYDNGVPEDLPMSRLVLPDLLSNAAHEFPDRAALIFFGQHISYRELDLLSNRFANAMHALGMRPSDRVAVVLPNLPQCVITFYGTLKAGGVVVMGSPLSAEAEIAAQLRDAGARAVVTLSAYGDLMRRVCAAAGVEHLILTDVREYLPLPQRLRLAGRIEQPTLERREPKAGGTSGYPSAQVREWAFQELLRGHSSEVTPIPTTCDDLALLQYTSGTTEVPKSVMLSHANLVVNVMQNRHWMPDARRGGESILGVLPLSHSYGITECMNLAMGLAASLVLLPTVRTREILRAVRRYQPTIFPAVPAIYVAVAHFPKVRRYGIASIRACISGSAPLPVEVQEAFEKLTKGRLVEGYGLTEASPVTHCNPLQGERRIGSIGIPLPGTQARIVHHETGEPLPTGEVGELLVRGRQVMRGYWHQPEETAQVLADGWLHTGDLARMDEDGFFTLVDRKKDMILSGTYNVYPRDVEEVLYEHPKVLEAVVVATRAHDGAESDSAGGASQSPLIKAIVVLRRGERATAEELLALCRERLDAYKVPAIIEFRTELPKNLVGKVLRRLLVEG